MPRTRLQDKITTSLLGPIALNCSYNPNGNGCRWYLGSGSVPVNRNITGNNVLITTSTGGGTYSSKVGKRSEITDTIGSKFDYHDVLHTVDDWNCPAVQVPESTWTSKPPIAPSDFPPYGQAPIQCRFSGWVSALPAFTVPIVMGVLPGPATLEARACAQLHPDRIPVKIDLPRFIGELSDLKDIWELARGKLTKALGPDLTPVFRDMLRSGVTRNTVKDRLAQLVGADIARKFFFEPFITDVDKIWTTINHLDASYARLKKGQSFVTRASSKAEASGSGSRTTSAGVEHLSCDTSIVCTAWMEVYQPPISLTPMELLRSQLGLYPKLRSAWELLPLSFVVDWFVDIGRFIGQFDGAEFSVPFSVRESGVSFKTTSSYQGGVQISLPLVMAGFGSPSDVAQATGTRTMVNYQRTKKSLTLNTSVIEPLQFKLPNLGQVGTLAELLFLALRPGNGALPNYYTKKQR